MAVTQAVSRASGSSRVSVAPELSDNENGSESTLIYGSVAVVLRSQPSRTGTPSLHLKQKGFDPRPSPSATWCFPPG